MTNYKLTLDIACNKTTDIFPTPLFDFNKSDEVYFLIGAMNKQGTETNFTRFPRAGSKDGTNDDDTFYFLKGENKSIVIGNFNSAVVGSTIIRVCEEDNQSLADIINFVQTAIGLFQSETAKSVINGIDWLSKTLDLKTALQDDTIGSLVLTFDNQGTPSLQDENRSQLSLIQVGNNYVSQTINLNGSGANYDITLYLDAQ